MFFFLMRWVLLSLRASRPWVFINPEGILTAYAIYPPLISIADGLRAISVSEAAFRSLYEGREVTIAEVEDDRRNTSN